MPFGALAARRPRRRSTSTLAKLAQSACVIRIAPGEKVRPAHSHPNGEEVIHIVTGSGRVLVDGEVTAIEAGTTVLFPQGKVHMVHNTGAEPMKVVCFVAPPTGLENYRMHEGVDFPD